MSDFHPCRFYIYIKFILITSLNLRNERESTRKWFDAWRNDRKSCFLISLCKQGFFNIDFLLFHVHSTVPFFPKLVIPVHVSMEEPVLKTNAEKSTSVNAIVDGKETIAKKIWQVAFDIKKRSYYIFVACKKSRAYTGITLRWLDLVILWGYYPTLKLSGIPTFTFIVSVTHKMDNI